MRGTTTTTRRNGIGSKSVEICFFFLSFSFHIFSRRRLSSRLDFGRQTPPTARRYSLVIFQNVALLDGKMIIIVSNPKMGTRMIISLFFEFVIRLNNVRYRSYVFTA